MQNPKIHSTIDQFIPKDHWLMQAWLDHPDPEDDRPGVIVCETCGRIIYTFTGGTELTWVETGRIVDRHGHEEPQTTCIVCFAGRSTVVPDMDPMYALTDDGLPQSFVAD
jgi:hypothetical protein